MPLLINDGCAVSSHWLLLSSFVVSIVWVLPANDLHLGEKGKKSVQNLFIGVNVMTDGSKIYLLLFLM